MTQYRVAALEKDMPFPSDCALSRIIGAGLNPSILPLWTTSATKIKTIRSEESGYAAGE